MHPASFLTWFSLVSCPGCYWPSLVQPCGNRGALRPQSRAPLFPERTRVAFGSAGGWRTNLEKQTRWWGLVNNPVWMTSSFLSNWPEL